MTTESGGPVLEESILKRLTYFVRRPVLARSLVREGWKRVQFALAPTLQAGVAVAVAFVVSRYVLGHQDALFAGMAAWACLGFTFDRDLRRIAEIGLGVVLGVLFGDFVVGYIGSGWWQMASVLIVAVLAARFIDRGQVLAGWAGTQSVAIVMSPNLTGGLLGRAVDAFVGVVVALVVVAVTPADPQRQLRSLGVEAMRGVSETASMIAAGVRQRSERLLESAVLRSREAEPALLEWLSLAVKADEMSRIIVTRRTRRRRELDAHERRALHTERTVESLRLVARRAHADVSAAPDQDREALASLLDGVSHAASCLERAILAGQEPSEARSELKRVAHDCYPPAISGFWGVRSTVLVLRATVVDMLQTCGLSERAAKLQLRSLQDEE